MKKNNFWKRFWTMDVHNHEGFTLVELIIVIAILAILSSVAVVGYSAYIKKANQQADRTLISEVKSALELYYYDNINEISNEQVTLIYVILGQEGEVVRASSAGEEAMEAAFGSNWKNLSLKYAGWAADSYTASSYAGKEGELIGVVDGLSDALGELIKNDPGAAAAILNGEFLEFLTLNGVGTEDGTAVGNAAVLYVAQNTKDNSEVMEVAFSKALEYTTANEIINTLFAETPSDLGVAVPLSAAMALAEGYAQYIGKSNEFHDAINDEFDDVANPSQAMTALGNAFGVLGEEKLEDYIESGQAMADAKGYIAMMGTVHENEDLVSGNLSADDCFTDGTVADMLAAYTQAHHVEEGQVGIYLEIKDGVLTITATSDDQ